MFAIYASIAAKQLKEINVFDIETIDMTYAEERRKTMKNGVRRLIRKHGTQLLLEEVIAFIESTNNPEANYLTDLINDLSVALNRYKTRYERYPDNDDNIQEPDQPK